MKPSILKAKDFDDMEEIAKPFLENSYKIMSSEPNYILIRKRNFGKIYIHVLFLFLILFVISYNSILIYLACGLYIVYFLYYLFKKSKIILITTETLDKDGNPVEFDDIDDIKD
ncbi:MAG: hypothetical protein LBM26_05640 [Methanobrevibacter sp.]|jgi:hypothetical protein|nr:hypothetical protein [Methanobrevibacter sp.]